MSTANASPIDTPILVKDFKTRLLEGTYDPDYLISLGSGSSGSAVIVKVRNWKGTGRNRKIIGTRLASLLITDLATPTGVVSTAISGKFSAFGAANVIFGPGPQIWILKTAVIVTDGTAGNRSIRFGNIIPSSKSVAPSTTGDLLDREILVVVAAGLNQTMSINNGVAGDSLYLSAVQIG